MQNLRGWKFPIQVDEDTGRIKTVENNENVKQSVRLILETQQFERKIFTNFGTDLRSYMFEVVNPPLITSLKNAISSSLQTWEKHITDLNVSVRASSGPVSVLESSVDYTTDIEPTQERVSMKIDASDKE